MHETLIAQQMLELALDAARKEGATRVLALRVRMGELEGISAAAIQAAFDLAALGTPAEGASVVVEPRHARVACMDCGRAPARVVHGHEGVPLERCSCGGRYRVIDGAGWTLLGVRAQK